MTKELTQYQVTSSVANRIEEMKGEGLMIAPNYSVSNALSSAYYALKNSSNGNLLIQCTPDSIYNALLEMVTQGLSPAKKQCYFIKYGQEVQLRMSYFGTVKAIKQLQDVKDVIANVVYEGDDLEIAIENGRKKLVEHKTNWQNADNPIIAAYCIITREDGQEFFEIMTKAQIDKSWSKAKTKNVQVDFPDQMAMRTVINRASKLFINTSDDSDLLAGAINNTIADEYDNDRQVKEAKVVNDKAESLDSILGQPQPRTAVVAEMETTEIIDVPEAEVVDRVKDVPLTEDVAISEMETTLDTNYLADEIPGFVDEETGKNIEEISLFEGNTTQIKE